MMATFTVVPLARWVPQDLDHRPRRTRSRNPRLAALVYSRTALVQLVAVCDELLTAPTSRTPEDLALCLAAARGALASTRGEEAPAPAA